ncbi:MAG TPA: CrcB family protein [Acidimicrobiales bacterium]|nr:CrcB family protein [Acidimicrobiales bacterium]
MPEFDAGGSHRCPEPPLRILAIAGGGALGTLARYGVARTLPTVALGFPWPTFSVNVAGSFLVGVVVTLVVERWPPTRFVRPFAAIGFCGGFTTYSTMAVEAVQRGQHGRVGPAAAYLVVSLVAGLVAAGLGITLVRGRILAIGGDRSIPDPDDLGVLFAAPAAPSDATGAARNDDADNRQAGGRPS